MITASRCSRGGWCSASASYLGTTRPTTPTCSESGIILEHTLDIWNASGTRYSSGPSHTGSSRLDDLLRVMLVLDGQPELDHRQGTYHILNEHFGYNRHSEEAIEIAGMIKIRCGSNGNGHVQFLRLDLVEQLNKIVAKHHPGALPPKR